MPLILKSAVPAVQHLLEDDSKLFHYRCEEDKNLFTYFLLDPLDDPALTLCKNAMGFWCIQGQKKCGAWFAADFKYGVFANYVDLDYEKHNELYVDVAKEFPTLTIH